MIYAAFTICFVTIFVFFGYWLRVASTREIEESKDFTEWERLMIERDRRNERILLALSDLTGAIEDVVKRERGMRCWTSILDPVAQKAAEARTILSEVN